MSEFFLHCFVSLFINQKGNATSLILRIVGMGDGITEIENTCVW